MSKGNTSDLTEQDAETAPVATNFSPRLVASAELDRYDADVVLALRNVAAGNQAALAISAADPDEKMTVHEVDLGNPLLGALLRSLAEATDGGTDEVYVQTAAEVLAVHLVTHAGQARTRFPQLQDARILQAVAFMHEQLERPVRLVDIAGAAGLSPYYFIRTFKQETGMTPGRYLTRLRIERAKHLLDDGMTVAQAARRCGFANPGHLSATFLRETGLRPSVYRTRHNA